MKQIDEWFSTPIGSVSTEKDFKLTNYCFEIMSKARSGGVDWVGGPYNTYGTYDILNDPKFKELNTWVENGVDYFTTTCGYAKTKPVDAWFNIYSKGDYQEYHVHQNCHFSCIFYLDTKEDDAMTVFHRNPMQMTYWAVDERKNINTNQVYYEPKKGVLLIFKSDTLHMVERKETDDIRITVSYNFRR